MRRTRNHLKKQVKEYLDRMPEARERKNRYRAIRHFLIERFSEFEEIPKERLISFVDLAVNSDRYFRKVPQEYPHLRGKDYLEKTVLEQEAQVDLGYEGGGLEKLPDNIIS